MHGPIADRIQIGYGLKIGGLCIGSSGEQSDRNQHGAGYRFNCHRGAGLGLRFVLARNRGKGSSRSAWGARSMPMTKQASVEAGPHERGVCFGHENNDYPRNLLFARVFFY